MKYKFRIIETYSKVVEVEAENMDSAHEKVEEMINTEESPLLTMILKTSKFTLMETKTSKAISLLHSGYLKEALAIFSTFRVGFSKEERRTLKIAHECLSGNAGFYRQLGIDTSAEVEKSKSILIAKYL